mgnify:CR=1 FL=1
MIRGMDDTVTTMIIILAFVLVAVVFIAWWGRTTDGDRWEATARHAADRRLLHERVRERDREIRRLRAALERSSSGDPDPSSRSRLTPDDRFAPGPYAASRGAEFDQAIRDAEIRVTENPARVDLRESRRVAGDRPGPQEMPDAS